LTSAAALPAPSPVSSTVVMVGSGSPQGPVLVSGLSWVCVGSCATAWLLVWHDPLVAVHPDSACPWRCAPVVLVAAASSLVCPSPTQPGVPVQSTLASACPVACASVVEPASLMLLASQSPVVTVQEECSSVCRTLGAAGLAGAAAAACGLAAGPATSSVRSSCPAGPVSGVGCGAGVVAVPVLWVSQPPALAWQCTSAAPLMSELARSAHWPWH